MQVTHDLHVHTNLSLCAEPETNLQGYIQWAKAAGIKTLAVCNHLWDHAVPGRNPWYDAQDFNHICKIRDEIKQIEDPDIKILFGAETEYCYQEHKIAISEEAAAQLDVLLVPNSHTNLSMPQEFYPNLQRHADFMLRAYHDILDDPNSKYITAMAHPFVAMECPYAEELLIPFISDSQFRECFEETAAKNIAVEINATIFCKKTPSQIRNSEFLRILQIARDCNCMFSFGSDAHSYNRMKYVQVCGIVADMLNLTEQQIINI
jgi:histidinol phosphatase-like PHP family hydrolase